jgi:VWFA-related protein
MPSILAAVLALAASTSSPQQQPANREGSVRRELHVGRVEIDAYVTSSSGDPIPDLLPSDFRVEIDGRSANVESAEWVPAERSEGAPSEPAAPGASASPGTPEPPAGPRYAPGRLLVFFFQSDFQKARLTGLVRMARQARDFVRDLLPSDRVAVVSFDSHLKLRCDFTDDKDVLDRAIFEGIKAGPTAAPDPTRFPTLAEGWDPAAARRASTPDRALALLAKSLAKLPGAKTLLFFGWGLHIREDPKQVADWVAALRGLAASRTSLFSLDVTDADFHTLETTLEVASDLTGGTYEKTHIFPQLAVARVARAISGRYVLVVVRPEGRNGFHSVSVALAQKKGRVSARSFFED